MGLSIIDYKTMIIEGVACGDTDTQTLIANNIDVLWSMHNNRACRRELQYLYTQRDAIQLAMDNVRMMIQQGNSLSQSTTTNVFDASNQRDQASQESQQAARHHKIDGTDDFDETNDATHNASRHSESSESAFSTHDSPYDTAHYNNKDLSHMETAYDFLGNVHIDTSNILRQRDDNKIDNRSHQSHNDTSYTRGDLQNRGIDLDHLGAYVGFHNPLLFPNYNIGNTSKRIFLDEKISLSSPAVGSVTENLATTFDSSFKQNIVKNKGEVLDNLGTPLYSSLPDNFLDSLDYGFVDFHPQLSTWNTQDSFSTRITSAPFVSVDDPLVQDSNFRKVKEHAEGKAPSDANFTQRNIHRDSKDHSELNASASSNMASSDISSLDATGNAHSLAHDDQLLTAQHTSDGTTHSLAHGVGAFNSSVAAATRYLNQLFDNLNQMYNDVLKEIQQFERGFNGGIYSLQFMWVKFPPYNLCAIPGNNPVLRGVPCNVSPYQGNAFTYQQLQAQPNPAGGSSVTLQQVKTLHYEIPSGVINGSNPNFLLISAPNPDISLMLYKNGVLMKLGVNYTLLNRTITFLAGSIPTGGDVLFASYEN